MPSPIIPRIRKSASWWEVVPFWLVTEKVQCLLRKKLFVAATRYAKEFAVSKLDSIIYRRSEKTAMSRAVFAVPTIAKRTALVESLDLRKDKFHSQWKSV
jgi:hypothetical protein